MPSIIAGVALLVAVAALLRALGAARRAERLAESYWELRYEVGQMRVRLNQLETATGVRQADPDAESAAPRPAQTTTFVPLSSLKK